MWHLILADALNSLSLCLCLFGLLFSHQNHVSRAERAVKGIEETSGRKYQWNGTSESLANARWVSLPKHFPLSSISKFSVLCFCLLWQHDWISRYKLSIIEIWVYDITSVIKYCTSQTGEWNKYIKLTEPTSWLPNEKKLWGPLSVH